MSTRTRKRAKGAIEIDFHSCKELEEQPGDVEYISDGNRFWEAHLNFEPYTNTLPLKVPLNFCFACGKPVTDPAFITRTKVYERSLDEIMEDGA